MMRWIRACVVALAAGSLFAVGPAAAEPLPVPSAPAPGSLPDLIDRLLPAPPIGGPDAMRLAVMPTPTGDPIFDAWPADLGRFANGQLIETRDVTATAGVFMLIPVRQVTLLKFRTTDSAGVPSYATATLVIPAAPWQGAGSRPVVVNNLPIDALGRACTPSYTMAHGYHTQTSLTDFIPPTTQLAASRGYAVLIPDHEGPRMAYAEPYVAGHAVLDAIRATRGFLPEFGASRFGMTGYSGGAIATNGAVRLLDSYAPELSGAVVGAALGGVPADFSMLARSMNGNLASGVFAGAVFGIGRERPEILAQMNHLSAWVAMSPMKDQCVSVFALPGVTMLPLDVGANIDRPLESAVAKDIFRITKMAGMKSGAPLYVYNGAQEFWIPAEGARNLYAEQCGLGVSAVYRNVLGEHVIAAALGYPEAMSWLDQRLQGVPAPNEC